MRPSNFLLDIWIILLLLGALLFTNCNKDEDPCQNTYCMNGGECFEGECECPPGFYGPHCEYAVQADPCENVTCYNGGECVNGECECPPGFYGSQCQFEMTPTYMRITGVILKSWPGGKPNGSVWDIPTGPIGAAGLLPDIYFQFLKNGASVGTTSYHTNCTGADAPFVYSGFSYTFPVSAEVTVKIWDFDGDQGSEEMAGGKFVPIEWSSGLKKTLSMGNSSFSFDLEVEWVFN